MEAFETVLAKLLVADNDAIKQATVELRQLLQSGDALHHLCQVLACSNNPQVRQYACLLLRKRLLKTKQWRQQDQQFQNSMKTEILRVLAGERERPVKNAIAQLLSCVARHELVANGWPDLLLFLSQSLTSSSDDDKELGIYTLSIISQSCSEQLLPHCSQLLSSFHQLLTSCSRPEVHYHVIQSFTNLVPLLGTEHLVSSRALVPPILVSTRQLAGCDELRAVEALDLLDALVDQEVPILSPHVPAAVELCLQLAAEKQLGDDLRSKALHCVEWLARNKKAIGKHKLMEAILQCVLGILASPELEDEEDEDSPLDEDSSSLLVACTRLIDALAVNMSPDKLLTPLLQLIGPMLTGDNVHCKRAAFYSLAMVAEGCSERIRTRYLSDWVHYVCAGIQHENKMVRNAALFALGQFAEYLQPDIGRMASSVMPVLLTYLSSTVTAACQKDADPVMILNCDRVFYALESMCETLGALVEPYIEPLMQQLLLLLQLPTAADEGRLRLLELAASAVGPLATAAEQKLLPYLQPLLTVFRQLVVGCDVQQHERVLTQSLDSLGVLARALGAEPMGSVAGELMALGMGLVERHNDPDMRRAAYALFGSLSYVLLAGMAPYLPKIIGWMHETLSSLEGVSVEYRQCEGVDNAVLDVFDQVLPDDSSVDLDTDTTDTEDGDDRQVTGYNIENSYLAEKEEALCSLRTLAENCDSVFADYLSACFEDAFHLLIHTHEDIRKAAVDSLVQFCLTEAKIVQTDSDDVQQTLALLLPHLYELVMSDEHFLVSMAALEGMSQLLKDLGPAVLRDESHLPLILESVTSVMAFKTKCQKQRREERENGGCDEEDEEESEYDEMLVECAGDVIPCLGHALSTQQFNDVFNSLYPSLLLKSKKSRSEVERSFALGCISECLEHLGCATVSQLLPQLIPLFCQAAAEQSAHDLQSNAVFGLGELLYRADVSVSRNHFSTALSVLSAALSDSASDRTRDNICGAVARLILADVASVPLPQVFPVFVSCLPLSEDFAENETVFRSVHHLYSAKHEILLQHIPQLINCALTIHNTKQEEHGDTARLVREFIVSIRRDFPQEMATLMSSLSAELVEKLASIQ